MSKIIWILCILLIGGYFVNSYFESNAKREADRIERENIKKKIKSSVQNISSRTNAVSDWESKLSRGKRYRLEPILTLELEKLWVIERPILFYGSIQDIKTFDKDNYIVVIEKSFRSGFGSMYGTDLMLSLEAPKTKIDTFLRDHPDLLEGIGFNNSVAVVAKINSIKTTYISGGEGDRKEIKTGYGSMIDLEYIGDLRL